MKNSILFFIKFNMYLVMTIKQYRPYFNSSFYSRILVLLIFTFCSKVFSAQTLLNTDFEKITVEKGLSNSVVYKVLQDNDGFMWFATKDGLNKYDGINVTKYSLLEDSYKNSKDNHILSLHQSENTPLYCATAAGGIFKYNNTKDTFEKINTTGDSPLTGEVYDILSIDSTKLLVCTPIGFYYVNILKEKVYKINKGYSTVRTVFIDSYNNYWLSTMEGVHKGYIVFTDTSATANLDMVKGLEEKMAFSITEDDNHNIWIGTRNNGIFLYNNNTQKVSDINSVLLKRYGNLTPVRKICILSTEIILGLDGHGICILDKTLNIKKTYSHLDDVSGSISSNGVYDIEFSPNNMWVATYGGGVNKINLSKKGFINLKHETNNVNSLSNNTARSFIETASGHYWFGTKQGISIFNPKNGQWRHTNLGKPQNYNLIVLSLSLSKKGHVLVGTYKDGFFTVNPSTLASKQMQMLDSEGKQIGSNFVFTAIEDQLGRFWSGGIRAPISVYNPKEKKTEIVKVNDANVIRESPWGKLYAGSNHGLFEIDPVTLEVGRTKPENSLLIRNRVFAIHCDTANGNKAIWVGTEGGGLLRLDFHSKEISVLSVNDGLPSSFIYGIVEDDKKNIWLSTTNGICELNPLSKEIKVYDYSDGLGNQEFNYGAYGKTSKGEIVFGGQQGFTIFNPENLVTDSVVPNLIFNSFKLFGKEQTINGEENLLSKHINYTSNLNLKHNQNSVAFGFAAINFTNPFKVYYRYKLEGFDAKWSVPGISREAIYTNLKPGNYTFKVQSSNHHGVWGNNERSINLTITPPFSRTLWAYLIYYIIFTAITILVIQFFRSRAKEKNALEKTRFFVNIAHDLRTPLTLVKAPLEQLAVSNKIDVKDKGSLLLARKNVDRLNRLVTQLMDFQKADLDKMQFAPAKYFFVEFLKETTSSFMPLIYEQEINYSIQVPRDDFEWVFDKNKIEKVVFNLMSNAVKYTHKKGSIKVVLEQVKDNVCLTFTDSGIGIPKEQQEEIFTRYFRAKNVVNSQETGSGVGLMLVKKLVEIHEGTIKFSSKEGEGTTFEVILPKIKYAQTGNTIISDEPTIIKPFNDKSIEQNINRVQRNFKILFVEDNKELRDYASNILNNYYKTFIAENGKQGLEIVKSKHPDLVISDIMMPEMDGNQLCDKLKNNIDTCHIPVILLTALDTIEYKLEGMRVGADAYIEKPFDMSYLLARVENLLKTRQQLKDKFAFYTETEETPDILNDIDKKFLDDTKSFIIENIMKTELSVEMLTKELGMSRPVLYRKLKALTDQSPQDFIRLIRLVEAKKLLNNKSKSISDVAYETGFSDPKYFSTSFKKQFGCTPTQFTKS